MKHPFNIGDKVTTKIKGQPVEATVTQTFNQEVQVRTADKKLLWRVVKTVSKADGTQEPQATGAEHGTESTASEIPIEPEREEAASEVASGPGLKYKRTRSRHKRKSKI